MAFAWKRSLELSIWEYLDPDDLENTRDRTYSEHPEALLHSLKQHFLSLRSLVVFYLVSNINKGETRLDNRGTLKDVDKNLRTEVLEFKKESVKAESKQIQEQSSKSNQYNSCQQYAMIQAIEDIYQYTYITLTRNKMMCHTCQNCDRSTIRKSKLKQGHY